MLFGIARICYAVIGDSKLIECSKIYATRHWLTALSARRALAQTIASRQDAAVALIRPLGWGWRADAV